MSEELEEIIEEIDAFEIINPKKVEIELYDINKTTLQSQLVVNTDVNFSYAMENRVYEYKFTEPIYINHISIKSKANDLKDMVVKVITIDNDEISFDINGYTKYDYIRVTVKNIIKGFKLIPPKKVKKGPKINLEKIEVFGYKISRFEELKKHAITLNNLQTTLKNESKKVLEENKILLSKIEDERKVLEESHEKLDEEIETLTEKNKVIQTNKVELEKEITNKKQLLDTVTKNLDKSKTQIADLSSKEQLLKDSIQQKETSIQTLNTKISQINMELKEAESNRDLIAYDLQEYVKNANKDIQVYIALSVIPWILIAVVTIMILGGSADLTTVLKVEKNAQIWTIFWSRIPFVIAVGTVLFVAYEISNIFVRRIIDIHQQKLDFAKIGIIAKDVSDASTDSLELSDQDIFELRTKLKMDMLKSHLSRELGKKYEYKINPNIWQRYKEMLSLKKQVKDALEIEEKETN